MPLSAEQARQVETLSRSTGLDPRVVISALIAGVPAQRLGTVSGLQGQTPGQELVGVSRATGFDIQRLFGVFEQIFTVPALQSSYMNPGTAPAVAATAGTGSASDWTSFDLTGVPGAVSGAASGVGQAVGGFESGVAKGLTGWVGDLTGWIKTYAIRAAEVVGGFLLVLAGLYLLARQVGLASSVPGGAQVVQAVS